MPKSNSFKAWVELKTEGSEWRKLKEYRLKRSVDSRGLAKVSCHIASKAGRNFRVCVALPKSKLKGVHHYVDLELDGIGMALSQSAIDRDPQAVEDKTVHFGERLVDNDMKVREFMFKEEEFLNVDTRKVGTVRLQVNSVVRYKQRERPQTRPPPAVDTVHEEKKRNLKHSVGFREAKPIEVVTSALIPIGVTEICSFVFNYRDMGTLVAGEIALPRGAPSASRQRTRSEARDEPIQDDDDDEEEEEEEEEEEGFGRMSMSPPSDEDIVYVAHVIDPRRRSPVKQEPEPEALPKDSEVQRVVRSVAALSVDGRQSSHTISEVPVRVLNSSVPHTSFTPAVPATSRTRHNDFPVNPSKRKLAASDIIIISDDEEDTKEDPLIAAYKACIAALQKIDKMMARRMAVQEEIAKSQGDLADFLAQKRGFKMSGSRSGRVKKRVKTEVLGD